MESEIVEEEKYDINSATANPVFMTGEARTERFSASVDIAVAATSSASKQKTLFRSVRDVTPESFSAPRIDYVEFPGNDDVFRLFMEFYCVRLRDLSKLRCINRSWKNLITHDRASWNKFPLVVGLRYPRAYRQMAHVGPDTDEAAVVMESGHVADSSDEAIGDPDLFFRELVSRFKHYDWYVRWCPPLLAWHRQVHDAGEAIIGCIVALTTLCSLGLCLVLPTTPDQYMPLSQPRLIAAFVFLYIFFSAFVLLLLMLASQEHILQIVVYYAEWKLSLKVCMLSALMVVVMGFLFTTAAVQYKLFHDNLTSFSFMDTAYVMWAFNCLAIFIMYGGLSFTEEGKDMKTALELIPIVLATCIIPVAYTVVMKTLDDPDDPHMSPGYALIPLFLLFLPILLFTVYRIHSTASLLLFPSRSARLRNASLLRLFSVLATACFVVLSADIVFVSKQAFEPACDRVLSYPFLSALGLLTLQGGIVFLPIERRFSY